MQIVLFIPTPTKHINLRINHALQSDSIISVEAQLSSLA